MAGAQVTNPIAPSLPASGQNHSRLERARRLLRGPGLRPCTSLSPNRCQYQDKSFLTCESTQTCPQTAAMTKTGLERRPLTQLPCQCQHQNEPFQDRNKGHSVYRPITAGIGTNHSRPQRKTQTCPQITARIETKGTHLIAHRCQHRYNPPWP